MQNRTARRLALVAAAVAVGLGVVAATGFGQAKPSDPITATRYALTVDGYEVASFSELSGIVTEIKPVDYVNTQERSVEFKKLPGQARPATITLKRALSGGLELWSWHEAVYNGTSSARRSAALVMYNSSGKPVSRYFLESAWPSKLEISALKSGSSEALVETVTLVAERIQRAAP